MKAPTDFQTRPVQISIGVSFWWAEVDSNQNAHLKALKIKDFQDYAPTMPQANFSFILYIF